MEEKTRKRITKAEVVGQSFAKFYKFLLNDEFKELTSDAKLLYTILRDRHELSVKNNWVNSKGEIYLIYTQENIAKMLNCSLRTVTKSFAALNKVKLIQIEKQGLNQPNKIYILDVKDIETVANKGRAKYALPDMQNMHASKTDYNYTDINTSLLTNDGVFLIEYFLEQYSAKTGTAHRNISDNTLHQLNVAIEEYDINTNTIDEYFRYDLDCDYHIEHFISDGIQTVLKERLK